MKVNGDITILLFQRSVVERKRRGSLRQEERVRVRDNIWGRGGEVKGAWGLFDLGRCEQGQ